MHHFPLESFFVLPYCVFFCFGPFVDVLRVQSASTVRGGQKIEKNYEGSNKKSV
jgi:hypothetical protein